VATSSADGFGPVVYVAMARDTAGVMAEGVVTGAVARSPALGFEPDGTPVVVYVSGGEAGPWVLVIARQDGSGSWHEATLPFAGRIDHPTVSATTGRIVVAFEVWSKKTPASAIWSVEYRGTGFSAPTLVGLGAYPELSAGFSSPSDPVMLAYLGTAAILGASNAGGSWSAPFVIAAFTGHEPPGIAVDALPNVAGAQVEWTEASTCLVRFAAKVDPTTPTPTPTKRLVWLRCGEGNTPPSEQQREEVR